MPVNSGMRVDRVEAYENVGAPFLRLKTSFGA